MSRVRRDPPGPGRQGPRPLPVHLTAALTTWTSCAAAWPIWKHASPPWSPGRTAQAEAIRTDLRAADPAAFQAALTAHLVRRQRDLLDGILAYRRHPYVRDLHDPPAIWREGTTRLLDYGAVPEGPGAGAPVVLAVPSLINRAHILDLKAGHSLLRDLAASGLRPLLVDWDAPGRTERAFDFTAYIAGRLEGALEAALEASGGAPVGVLGYCMGGVMALALAQRRPHAVAGLALLATPWDFHAERPGHAALAARLADGLEPLLQADGTLPVDVVQTLFAGLDPLTAARKYARFAHMPEGPRAERFVAVEDWLNDGVPLAAPVARTCLRDWYASNAPARGWWVVAGRPVRPERIRCPSFVLRPRGDTIVPPASAAALADALPAPTVCTPHLGHIGMIVGGSARRAAWEPLKAWLHGTLRASPI